MFQRSMIRFTAPIALVCIAAAASLAWVPTQKIKAERKGLAKFAITGENTLGKVDVNIEDKHLFQGFSGEGTNGKNTVEFSIKSSGLAGGWDIAGKNGDIKFELKATKKGVLDKEWRVEGKVNNTPVDVTITGNWDVDPAIEAAVVAFDI